MPRSSNFRNYGELTTRTQIFRGFVPSTSLILSDSTIVVLERRLRLVFSTCFKVLRSESSSKQSLMLREATGVLYGSVS